VSAARLRISTLGKQDRAGFQCGIAPLDRYFQRQAGQDMRRRLSVCYVVEDQHSDQIAGFYTLSAADVPLDDAPEAMTRKLPRYPVLPAARIGRLAVDQRYQGRGIGGILLADAVARAAQSDVAIFAMLVDAKDAQAEAFYAHHGFSRFGSLPGQMIAAMKTLIG